MWYLYIVKCAGGALYTGITTDVAARVACHNSKKGSKFTRSRTPVRLKYSEECGDRSRALRRELEVKRMAREEKLALIKVEDRRSKIDDQRGANDKKGGKGRCG
jgi:predicted GIY-YIG superfamily endonuclease